jgi:hypothetical protein
MAHGVEICVPFVHSHLLERLVPWVASANPLSKSHLAGSAVVAMERLLDRRKTGYTTPTEAGRWRGREISPKDYPVGRVKYTDGFVWQIPNVQSTKAA